MTIILLVLKIIGIILLVLVAILLLLLGLLLFAPIRYAVYGKVEEEVFIRGRLTWLFPLILFEFSYENQRLEQKLRILGFQTKKKETSKQEFDEEIEEIEINTEQDVSEAVDNVEEAESTEKPEAERTAATSEEKRTNKKNFGTIKEWFQNLKHMILSIKSRISNIKTLLLDETNQKAAKIAIGEVLYLLKHFRFRKIETDLCFSMGDPAITGQALGILSMLPFLYQYQFHIYPDFQAENFYIKGTFDVKGRIRLIHVVVSLIRILKQRECRALIKKIMK